MIDDCVWSLMQMGGDLSFDYTEGFIFY